MSLIPCPECDAPISDRATKCTQCGYPVLTTRIKSSIPRVISSYISRPIIFLILAIKYIALRLVKPIIFLILIISASIIWKNHYFISQAEKLAWETCQGALGKKINTNGFGITSNSVEVPSLIDWYKQESRMDEFYHLNYFHFRHPYAMWRIDIHGKDEHGHEWVCTPEIASGDLFTSKPYNSDLIYRIQPIK